VQTQETPQLDYTGEVWRKLLHLVALSIPVGYYIVPHTAAVLVPMAVFAFSLVVDFARFRGWPIQRYWRRWTDPIVRPKEEHNFTGATNILASGWLCPLLFTRPAAAVGMTVIILGDVAAALIGRRWGRHRFFNGRSIEGSLAFLVAAAIGATLIPGVNLILGLTAAVLATVVEAFSRRVDDNLSVPLIVGLYVHLALRWI
jgi:dolichol kinase